LAAASSKVAPPPAEKGETDMAARAIASLTISFGLVAIPVKLYSATQASERISFNLLHGKDGSRLRQQYVCLEENVVVERDEIVRGYEFAKDQYVVFTNDELKALEETATNAVDITEFVPVQAVDPVYFDKAYYVAPDKGGAKPYALLTQALGDAGLCALGRWAARGKQYIVMLRPAQDGLVMQQLLYAHEVRSMAILEIPKAEVKEKELELARQLVEQGARDSFDPGGYTDEVKERIEEAIQKKVAGQQITVAEVAPEGGAKIIDLMEALRASLQRTPGGGARARAAESGSQPEPARPAKRASKRAKAVAPAQSESAVRKTARRK